MISMRQSFLKLADNCLHSAYLYGELHGWDLASDGGVPSHPTIRGKAFHEFAHRAVETLKEHGHEQIDPIQAKAVLTEVLEEHPEWTLPAAEHDLLRVMVHHWATFFRLPHPECVCEAAASLEVAGSTVTGTIDLAWHEGGTTFIRDYKAGWSLPAQSKVASPDALLDFQLGTYVALVDQGTSPIPRGEFYDARLVFPNYVDPEIGMAERGTVIPRLDAVEHAQHLESVVRRVKAAVELREWPAVPGKHCARCPAPARCPIPSDLRPVASVFEDPEGFALRLWAAKKTAKELQEELTEFTKEYGPVSVGDQEYGIRQVGSGSRFGLYDREVA